MVLVRWGVIYERRQGMQRIEYRYKCPTVVRGRQSSPTTLDLESNPPTGVFGSLFWPLIPAKTWFMTQNRIDGAAVIGQLNGCMSAPFQTCGVPLLLFVWPLYWTSKLTRVDLMITRTTTKQQTTSTLHSISVDLKPKKTRWDDASLVKTRQYFWIHGHNYHGGFRD